MPRRYRLPLGHGACIPAEQWMVEAGTAEAGGQGEAPAPARRVRAEAGEADGTLHQENPRGGQGGRDPGKEGVWLASLDRGQGLQVSSG